MGTMGPIVPNGVQHLLVIPTERTLFTPSYPNSILPKKVLFRESISTSRGTLVLVLIYCKASIPAFFSIDQTDVKSAMFELSLMTDDSMLGKVVADIKLESKCIKLKLKPMESKVSPSDDLWPRCLLDCAGKSLKKLLTDRFTDCFNESIFIITYDHIDTCIQPIESMGQSIAKDIVACLCLKSCPTASDIESG
jgi:hypothetical protein